MRYIYLTAVILVFTLAPALVSNAQKRPSVQTFQINITRFGYEPAAVTLRKGIAARLTFVRKTDDTCATEVVFPDYGIQRSLPLDQAVVVSLVPRRAGEFVFTCGMYMHRGRMIVK